MYGRSYYEYSQECARKGLKHDSKENGSVPEGECSVLLQIVPVMAPTFPAIAFLTALSAWFLQTAHANMAPSYPEPGTVWTAGKEYEILWEDDGVKPDMKKWKNFKIDLMTGDNNDQKFLTNIASNITSPKPMSLKYTAPDVEPHAPIYFLMFTNEDGESAWTTRFAIVGTDGKQEQPAHATQPQGEKIPWGVGKLLSSGDVVDNTVSVAAASASSVPSSVAEINTAASEHSTEASSSSSPTSSSSATASTQSAASLASLTEPIMPAMLVGALLAIVASTIYGM
ncbi:hypothetical protein BCR43DRAFT_498666 [Syncephalastrum racemosum]|uniref:Yeast cell wall synthesis Kre9/Knh1-like N-terminal domain-containing protein n=1 Tax=Syncephalastrum racemosum TaxID=13706 RepID=A0A1X2H185_SYNRA|nr:hypothetical protein BCR43DRAFT_498666 [Syncephalastrum racemosum]